MLSGMHALECFKVRCQTEGITSLAVTCRLVTVKHHTAHHKISDPPYTLLYCRCHNSWALCRMRLSTHLLLQQCRPRCLEPP